MRLRHFAMTAATSATLAVALAAAPALAHDSPDPGTAPAGPDGRPEWKEDRHHAGHGEDLRARDAWLADCRRRISARDDGLGGAVIGGLVGGLAGNRIARRGNRTVGTVAGAAVGAAAGMAIDKAEDSGRARDECEAYLDSYYGYYGHHARMNHGYGHPAYGYSAQGCCYAGPMMMVPIYRAPRGEPECTETVEYIYEDVPVRPKARRIPQKRIKIVPDKRIKTN